MKTSQVSRANGRSHTHQSSSLKGMCMIAASCWCDGMASLCPACLSAAGLLSKSFFTVVECEPAYQAFVCQSLQLNLLLDLCSFDAFHQVKTRCQLTKQ